MNNKQNNTRNLKNKYLAALRDASKSSDAERKKKIANLKMGKLPHHTMIHLSIT